MSLFFSNALVGRHKETIFKTKNYVELFEAVEQKNKNKIKYLIGEGTNINAYMFYQNCEQTPIHRALHNKSLDIAELLLNLGADIHSKDEFGETPLHYCCTKEYLNLAEKLITLGANVNTQRQGGMTPLHISASKKDSLDIIKLLIKKNADIYLNDMFGTPSFVHSIDNEEVLKYFLDLNLDVNIPLFANISMLHMSVFNENEKTTNLLIKHNANINQKTLFGITPIFLAVAKIIDSKLIEDMIFNYEAFNKNFYYEDDQPTKNINNQKKALLKILELLLKNNANINEKIQSINDFFNQNPGLKQNIERTYNDFHPQCPLKKFNIINNKFGFNLFHSTIRQYFMAKKILEYGKDDLEIKREKIINGYVDLNFILYSLLKNYKDMDLQGYSPYELIKKYYSIFIELVEKEDKNKELIHLRKLLANIKTK